MACSDRNGMDGQMLTLNSFVIRIVRYKLNRFSSSYSVLSFFVIF